MVETPEESGSTGVESTSDLRSQEAECSMEPEESGSTGVESTSDLSSQEAECSMEVDGDGTPLMTSGGTITVTSEEDQILTGDPTSVAGEMAKLQVSFPKSCGPEGSGTSQ